MKSIAVIIRELQGLNRIPYASSLPVPNSLFPLGDSAGLLHEFLGTGLPCLGDSIGDHFRLVIDQGREAAN